ncbi:phenylalanine--tRNA ligase subunit beta [Candidatus Woesearchaeota archaeon]|nr:phenylalanine--tRNA ligase subunit beta [Candidatus Woesearchaeota archaeon]
MPTINVNRKVLDKILGRKLTEDKLKDRISMLGTALESMDDEEILVEIFPNRPDMLSEQGFGRALSSFIGLKKGLRKYKVEASGEKCIIGKEMKDVRPYTACAIVKNLNLDDEKIKEIIEVQEKLHITFCRKRKKAAIGIYPFEKIKPPIYFKADVPERIVFRPLEFARELDAKQLLKIHPTGREYAHLVEKLDKYAYFIDSKREILSLTPIINSHLTGKITDRTKEAFIEVSGFDFNVCSMVLNILVCAIADMGGHIFSMELVYPDKTIVTPNLEPAKMHIDLDYVNKKLGLKINESQLKELLEKMGYDYKGKTAYVPAYRADVIHPIDIVEDIAIAYGYENFNPEIPVKATIGEENDFEKFKSKIAHLMIGLGFLETSSYHLSNKLNQCIKMGVELDVVELENALTQDYDALRAWLLPNLLQILGENKHNEYPQDLFEAGIVFAKDKKSETGIEEKTQLACLLCSKEADFTRIRQVLDYIMRALDLKYSIKETEHNLFIPGRAGKVIIGNKETAAIGEVHPQVLENFDLEMPVAAFELNLSEVFSILTEPKVMYKQKGLLQISTDILEKHPNLMLASKLIEHTKILKTSQELELRKQKLADKWKSEKDIESHKELRAYKDFHYKLGLKDSAVAAESLIKRYLSKGKFPNINSAVDAGNIVSVEYMTSIGMFDYDKVKGDIKVRMSGEGDKYLPYGQKAEQKIAPGRIVLEDEEKIFAVVGYKDSKKTSIDLSTKNILVVTWGDRERDAEKMAKVMDEIEGMVGLLN